MKIFVAGDYYPRNRVEELVEKEDYAAVFDEVRPLIKQADYSIVNFECSVVLGKAKPIEKSGPNLSCSERGVYALNYAGFKCVTLANNHFRDFGDAGVQDTITSLTSNKLDYVGGGMNLKEASQILYKKVADKTLAIINCCEHEFSIATEHSAGSNPLNPIHQYQAIVEAKKEADYVLVIVHGGHEHFQYPSLRMVDTYRFFIDAGADAVVNHHQHCFSGYEVYKGKPIFYGLGNFCFDNSKQHSGKWVEGYAVTIDFSIDKVSFSIHPLEQCANEAKVSLLPNDAFNNRFNEINETIVNRQELNKVIDQYYATSSLSLSWLFEPIRTRFYYIMQYRGWLPSLISKKRKLDLANHILTESYFEKLEWWLEH